MALKAQVRKSHAERFAIKEETCKLGIDEALVGSIPTQEGLITEERWEGLGLLRSRLTIKKAGAFGIDEAAVLSVELHQAGTEYLLVDEISFGHASIIPRLKGGEGGKWHWPRSVRCAQ